MDDYTDIREALDFLLERCDGARTLDGAGFNGRDAGFAREMAGKPRWTARQAAVVHKMLGTYRNTQLSGVYDGLTRPEVEPREVKKAMELTIDDVHERFDWTDSGLKQLRDGGCRRLLHMEPGETFWGMWSDCKDDLKKMGLSPRKDGNWSVNWWMRLDDWYALTACNGKRPRVSKKGLLPYQPAHVADLVVSIKQFGGALDGSDVGTGKTSCALAVARELKKEVLVVCPKGAIPTWRYWSDRMGINICDAISYEKIKTGNTMYLEKIESVARVKGKDVRKVDFRWNLADDALIVFDEVHRCGGKDTLESKLLLQAARQGYARLGLSGTVLDTPMRARALGPAFGLFGEGEFYAWAQNYSCGKYRVMGQNTFGFIGTEERKREAMERLHRDLFGSGRGRRMRSSEIKGFPEGRICADLVEATDAYNEILKAVSQSLIGSEVRNDIPLTELLRARQAAESAKVPEAVARARDLIEQGYSVVIFVNFLDALEKIAGALDTDCTVRGEQSGKVREENVRRFQANEERCIIVQYQSGGAVLSLHDLHGRPRIAIGMPTWNSLHFKQAPGRICRAGSLSDSVFRALFADCWPERRVHDVVIEKCGRIDLLNDGDLAETK